MNFFSSTKAKLFVLVAIILVVFFKYSQVEPSYDGETDKISIQEKKVKVNESDSKNIDNLNIIEAECNAPKPLFNSSKIRSISELKPTIQKKIELAIDDFSQFMVHVDKKDKDTSIAAFMLIRSCYPYGEDILSSNLGVKLNETATNKFCVQFPDDLMKNPLALLDNAAKAGSSEAKLMYAMSVRSMLKIMKFNGVNQSKDEEQVFIKTAETYGNSAAIEGLEEAYWFMASAYYGGMFGERDYTKAYAFTLSQMKTHQADDTQERLDSLYREMTMPQVRQAQILAFGCQNQPVKSSILLNPFQQ